MNAQHSIQDIYDLLVELITNCDDSYHRQFVARATSQDGGPILIELERHRGSKPSLISVGDRAEGLPDLRTTVKRVGERTSGSGDRGFMARGLKDCAALGLVTVESIHDEFFRKAEITPSFRFVPYEPGSRKGDRASDEQRQELGVPKGNGTRVSVELEARVQLPQLSTLVKELPWHYALRDITAVGGPSRVLVRGRGSRPQPAQYIQPEAEVVHDEEFQVPGYPFRARFTLYRAADALEDPADKRFRRTGILIQGRRAIHACTFLTSELERDPAAERYFGRLACDGIDLLAEQWDQARAAETGHPADNPILVLDPNRRTGLADNHPFTKALFDTPVTILKGQFEKDREEAKRSRREIESRETTQRLRRLARMASKFMREQLENLGAVSPSDEVSSKSYVERGISVAPSFTQVRVGEEKVFNVRAAPRLQLPLGLWSSRSWARRQQGALSWSGSRSIWSQIPCTKERCAGAFEFEVFANPRGCRLDAKWTGLTLSS
jgi:hypothetical protein